MKQLFEEIVEQHGGTVLRVCRVTVGVHDAEEAWSETFLVAMRAYPGLPDDANAGAWLISLAHRTASDALRARGQQPAPDGQVPEVPPVRGGPGEEDGDLWRVVTALPEKQRQAMAYHYIAGLAHADVAGILGGTTDAAHRTAADGARSLRKNYPGTAAEGRHHDHLALLLCVAVRCRHAVEAQGQARHLSRGRGLA